MPQVPALALLALLCPANVFSSKTSEPWPRNLRGVIDSNLPAPPVLFISSELHYPDLWERAWLIELFGIHEEQVRHWNLTSKCNEMPPVFLLILATPSTKQINDVVEEVRYRENIRFGIIHLSDQFLGDKESSRLYSLRQCAWVLRNYWMLNMPSKVTFFPLGYKHGFQYKPNVRDLIWSFAGDLSEDSWGTRKAMLDLLSNVHPHHVHVISRWNASGSLSIHDYSHLLSRSIFVPCLPGNWNIDTFRVYEALEAGAIPIVSRTGPNQHHDYWLNLLGPAHPLLVVDDWSKAASLMRAHTSRRADLIQLQRRVAVWWPAAKAGLRSHVGWRMAQLKAPTCAGSFCTQGSGPE
jgi:hypothetical protein